MIVLDAMEYSSDALAQAAWVSYTKLLLHMEGTDTSFTDSALGKTITASGSVAQSVTQAKFGSKSAVFSSSGNLSVGPSSDFNVGSGAFTVDFWFYPTVAGRYALFAFSSDFYFGMDFNYNGTRNVNIWASSNATSWNLIHADNVGGGGIGTASLSLNAWHHIAFVRNGNKWYSFIDGNKDIEVTVSGTVADPSSKNLRIGMWGNSAYQLTGYIDEFRFSKGVARWTENFTPPYLTGESLQCYSETSIVKEGIYSMKVIATSTSLNQTLTKICSPTWNLSGQTEFKINVHSSRTGSNFKIGLHDSGGTTTEVTPNIAVADTFQEVTLDLSAVADADKDAIDSIILTVTNADAENTIYLDYLRTLSSGEGTSGGGGMGGIFNSIIRG